MQSNTQVKFEVGRTYRTRFATDADSVLLFTVTRRSARFVTFRDQGGEVRRVGVKVFEAGEAEHAFPMGTYSMAPVVSAEDGVEPADEASLLESAASVYTDRASGVGMDREALDAVYARPDFRPVVERIRADVPGFMAFAWDQCG